MLSFAKRTLRERLAGCVSGIGLLGFLVACQSSPERPAGPVVLVVDPNGTPIVQAASPVPTAAPPNLIENGDFASDWSDGWIRETGPISERNITEIVEISHGPSGRALHLVHDGSGTLGVSQLVELPTLKVVFRAQIYPSADTPCRGILQRCSGAAGILLEFYGHQRTSDPALASIFVFYPGSDEHLWPTPDATHRYDFINPVWETVELELRREIENSLPLVDHTAIKAMRISIFAGSSAGCDPGECAAEIRVADISLRAISP